MRQAGYGHDFEPAAPPGGRFGSKPGRRSGLLHSHRRGGFRQVDGRRELGQLCGPHRDCRAAGRPVDDFGRDRHFNRSDDPCRGNDHGDNFGPLRIADHLWHSGCARNWRYCRHHQRRAGRADKRSDVNCHACDPGRNARCGSGRIQAADRQRFGTADRAGLGQDRLRAAHVWRLAPGCHCLVGLLRRDLLVRSASEPLRQLDLCHGRRQGKRA